MWETNSANDCMRLHKIEKSLDIFHRGHSRQLFQFAVHLLVVGRRQMCIRDRSCVPQTGTWTRSVVTRRTLRYNPAPGYQREDWGLFSRRTRCV